MVQSQHMVNSPPQIYNLHPASRPLRVTLLAVGVLTIASLHMLRLVEAVRQWQFLTSLAGVSPIYPALTGLIWAAVGLALFWRLWRGHAWAARSAPGCVVVFGLYYWLDRVWIANRAVSLTNWPVTAVLTAFGLVYTFWALRARASRDYFEG